jgi:hypothetical protein
MLFYGVIAIARLMSEHRIPLGAAAQVAIYADHWHHVSLPYKILLRIFLEEH